MSGDMPVSDELVLGLKCRLCGKLYPKEALNFCTEDFGPLEVVYDYEAVGRTLTRAAIAVPSPDDLALSRACCRSMASRPLASTSAEPP